MIMRHSSIWMKCLLCVVGYLTSLSLFFSVYTFNTVFHFALFLGISYGIFIAVVAYSDKVIKTIIAMFAGLFSAAITQILFHYSNAPYEIIRIVHRNSLIPSDGPGMRPRLALGHVIGYNWGIRFFFWPALLVTFVISIIVVLVIHAVKKRRN